MAEIQLNKGFVTIVDDEDYEYLSQFTWFVKLQKGVPYACRALYLPEAFAETGVGNNRKIQMSREIMGARKGEDVDHEDRDTLNHRKTNLRVCSRSQNCGNQKVRSTNTSGFKGVHWKEDRGAWCARICVSYKRIQLGYFSTAEEAARAYDTAAVLYFGEFARLNFPIQKESN